MSKLLEEKLKYEFKNKSLLQLALTHSSFNEGAKDKKFNNNENLEFLGDSVINLVITEYLYKRYKKHSEGELSKLKAHLVSTSSLFEIAKNIGMPDFIILGKGAEKNLSRQNRRIIASSFEALMGALFLDSNYRKTSSIIISFFIDFLNNFKEKSFKINDYKSELQEFIQKHRNILPVYETIADENANEIEFISSIILDDEKIGTGRGKTKRQAEQDAAMRALKKIDKISNYKELSKVFFLKN